MMFKAFFLTLCPLLGMCSIIYYGVFKSAPVELGPKHYAEIPSMTFLLPEWLDMPFNAIVNFGYAIVGAMWLAITSNNIDKNIFDEMQSFLFYVFNWMALFYSPVQLLRIITQEHEFAVLDQWVTLPFFMWVVITGATLLNGWSTQRIIISTLISVFSYVIVLFPIPGFEIALGLHIATVLYVARALYAKYPNKNAKVSNFIKAVVCCVGFVLLKIFDLELGETASDLQVFIWTFSVKDL